MAAAPFNVADSQLVSAEVLCPVILTSLVRMNIRLLQMGSCGDALPRQAGHVTVRQVLSQEPPAYTGGLLRTQQARKHHEHAVQASAPPEGCAVCTSGAGTGRRAAVRIYANTRPVRKGISQSFDQPTDQRLAGKQGHARRLRRVMSGSKSKVKQRVLVLRR